MACRKIDPLNRYAPRSRSHAKGRRAKQRVARNSVSPMADAAQENKWANAINGASNGDVGATESGGTNATSAWASHVVGTNAVSGGNSYMNSNNDDASDNGDGIIALRTATGASPWAAVAEGAANSTSAWIHSHASPPRSRQPPPGPRKRDDVDNGRDAAPAAAAAAVDESFESESEFAQSSVISPAKNRWNALAKKALPNVVARNEDSDTEEEATLGFVVEAAQAASKLGSGIDALRMSSSSYSSSNGSNGRNINGGGSDDGSGRSERESGVNDGSAGDVDAEGDNDEDEDEVEIEIEDSGGGGCVYIALWRAEHPGMF